MAESAVETQSPQRVFVYLVTYLRALLGIVVLTLYTALCSIVCIVVAFLGQRDLCTTIIGHWASVVLGAFGIRSEIKGEVNLPEKGGGIIVFNHQSLFDIPILMTSTKKHIRFGAKIELFRIPFFGRAMRAVGTLPIARENRSEVLKIYKEAAVQFHHDTIFCLAPEGTRQKEPQIGRFKKGPFIFAINAGVPIIPVVIRGAHEVLPKKSLLVNVGRWSRTIYVEFLPPVPTAGLSPEKNLETLVDQVRSSMELAYLEKAAND